jgi:hypothetical protein
MGRVATRRIGNYGECVLTMTRQEDGQIQIAAQTSCAYGDEWPLSISGEYAFAPFLPALRAMLIELDLDPNTARPVMPSP